MPIILSLHTHTYNHTLTHTRPHTHTRVPARHAQHVATCYVNVACESRRASTRYCQQICQLGVRARSCCPALHLPLSIRPLFFLSLDPFAVECDLCIAAELPDEVLCVLEIDNIIRNAHKLRTHTAERNGTKRECNGTKWNGTKTTDIGLPLDSCSLKRLIAMIQLHVLGALTLPFSPTVSIFPSPSRCLFCSCHLR